MDMQHPHVCKCFFERSLSVGSCARTLQALTLSETLGRERRGDLQLLLRRAVFCVRCSSSAAVFLPLFVCPACLGFASRADSWLVQGSLQRRGRGACVCSKCGVSRCFWFLLPLQSLATDHVFFPSPSALSGESCRASMRGPKLSRTTIWSGPAKSPAAGAAVQLALGDPP